MSFRDRDNVRNMMSDPTTSTSRVFVGNLPVKEISKGEIEDRFRKYGNILAITVHRGFGFIQFEDEEGAAEAIKHENGEVFLGKKIDVKAARGRGRMEGLGGRMEGMGGRMEGMGGGRMEGMGGGRLRSGGPGDMGDRSDGPGSRKGDMEERDPFRDRSPLDDRGRDRDWRERDRFDNYGGKGKMDRGGYYSERERDFGKDTRDFGKDARDFGKDARDFGKDARDFGKDARDFGKDARDFGKDARDFGKDADLYPNQDRYRGGPGPIGPGRDDRGNSFGKDSYSSGPGSYRPGGMGDGRGPSVPPRDYPPESVDVDPLERTNDCEIIVFNKEQREYAEYIERRLKQLDMSVDLLFPNEEVPISRILASISSRGTLYAISVMPQNEEHRSLTLNILHGLPQEHRNMPLEDAVPLIKRNFDAYRSGEKAASLAVPSAVPIVPAGTPAVTAERHPEAIQVLLNLLADNRQLTVLQYDRVIHYLQERREIQVKVELGDAKDMPTTKEPVTKQQVDLQHRILNILNNQSSGASNSAAAANMTRSPVTAPAMNMGMVGANMGAAGMGTTAMGAAAMAGMGQMGMGAMGMGSMGMAGMGMGGSVANAGASMNIGPVPAPVAPPTGNWQAQTTTSTPLLSDPTVQKALDSLMQGNLLRKITPTTGSNTSTMSSMGMASSQPLFGGAWGSGASKM